MYDKSNIDFKNIKRMKEIAQIYEITKQHQKSEKYHENIIRICEKYPKNEEMLTIKIQSLNCLKRPYKSLETTKELLNLNPNNLPALLNIIRYLKKGTYI
jgi:tetratricopeptide (TPR) repeat protein